MKLNVQNNDKYMEYCAPTNECLFHIVPWSATIASIFCPSDNQEIAFELPDLTGSNVKKKGAYHGVPCSIEAYNFTRSTPNLIHAQAQIYRDNTTRREIAQVIDIQEWFRADNRRDGTGKKDLQKTSSVREFEYNVPVSDGLFTFTPPPGTKSRNLPPSTN